MPTAPVHQGWRASQAMIVERVVLLLLQIFAAAARLRNRRSRACRRARRHSRGRRNRDASGHRAQPCRRAGDRAGIRGSPAPVVAPHPTAARSAPPDGRHPAWYADVVMHFDLERKVLDHAHGLIPAFDDLHHSTPLQMTPVPRVCRNHLSGVCDVRVFSEETADMTSGMQEPGSRRRRRALRGSRFTGEQTAWIS